MRKTLLSASFKSRESKHKYWGYRRKSILTNYLIRNSSSERSSVLIWNSSIELNLKKIQCFSLSLQYMLICLKKCGLSRLVLETNATISSLWNRWKNKDGIYTLIKIFWNCWIHSALNRYYSSHREYSKYSIINYYYFTEVFSFYHHISSLFNTPTHYGYGIYSHRRAVPPACIFQTWRSYFLKQK